MSPSIRSVAALYDYSTEWIPEDKEFVATVSEFPFLSWMESTKEKALVGLQSLLNEVVRDMISNGEPVPGVSVSSKLAFDLAGV